MIARPSSDADRPVRRRRLLASPALALAAIGIVGAGSVALAADASVTIAGSAFSPNTVTVNVADTVTWTNQDGLTHTATADGGSFDTGNLSNGESGAVTFNTAGSFPYHCAIHPQMIGTVVVQGAAATPAPSAPAPGATPRPTPPGTNTAAAAAPPSSDGAGIAILGVTAVAFALAMRLIGRRAPR